MKERADRQSKGDKGDKETGDLPADQLSVYKAKAS